MNQPTPIARWCRTIQGKPSFDRLTLVWMGDAWRIRIQGRTVYWTFAPRGIPTPATLALGAQRAVRIARQKKAP